MEDDSHGVKDEGKKLNIRALKGSIRVILSLGEGGKGGGRKKRATQSDLVRFNGMEQG
jgi:hypothetical protein